MVASIGGADKPKPARPELDVKLVINGEDYHDLPDNLSVADILTRLELPETKIAVERNRAIVPKSTFSQTALADGDRLEIIHFIGGG